MTSDHVKPEARNYWISFPHYLEVARQAGITHLIPVLIHRTYPWEGDLGSACPWDIADWDHSAGKIAYCGWKIWGQEVVTTKAKISWTKIGDPGQQPLSLGTAIDSPRRCSRRLSNL
jgi:hypothetical protein